MSTPASRRAERRFFLLASLAFATLLTGIGHWGERWGVLEVGRLDFQIAGCLFMALSFGGLIWIHLRDDGPLDQTMLKPLDQIHLPDGSRVVAQNVYADKNLTREAANNNVYRMDPQGRIVWQLWLRDAKRDALLRHASDDVHELSLDFGELHGYTLQGHRVRIDLETGFGHLVDRDVLRWPDGSLIVRDAAIQTGVNVFRIAADGRRMWAMHVEDPPQHCDADCDSFSSLTLRNGQLRVYGYSGWTLEIDPESGKAKAIEWTK